MKGRVAVVTGGANGIGLALARRFLAEGMKVAIADLKQESLDRASSTLDAGDDLLTVPADVSLEQDVASLARCVLDRFGEIHVVCNNAGVNAYGYTTWEAPAATYEWIFGVNVMGVVHGIRTFVPILREAGAGHIVNTASGQALYSAPLAGAYCASKHAVLAITEALQCELAAEGSRVRASVFCPGLTKTSIRDSASRWPERLGAPAAVGAAAAGPNNAQAKDPSVAADAVLDGILSDRFLILDTPTAGYAAMATRLRELAGGNP